MPTAWRRGTSGYRLRLEPYELDLDAVRRLRERPIRRLPSSCGVVPLSRSSTPLPGLETIGRSRRAATSTCRRRARRATEARRAGDRRSCRRCGRVAVKERTALLHIRALAADGRSADALACARAFRSRLVERDRARPDPGTGRAGATGGGRPGPIIIPTSCCATRRPDGRPPARPRGADPPARFSRRRDAHRSRGCRQDQACPRHRCRRDRGPWWSRSPWSTAPNGSARRSPRRSGCAPPARSAPTTSPQRSPTASCCWSSTTASTRGRLP